MARFLLAGVAIGLLVGIFEASLLWVSPHVAALLDIDVRYVIWFLAPVVDMAFFGFIGWVLGWLARRTRFRQLLVAVESGIVVAFIALARRWFHVETALQGFSFHEHVLVPLIYFSAGFAVSAVVLLLTGRRLAGWVERRICRVLKPAAWGLAAAAAVGIAGIGIFAAWPCFSGTQARAASSAPKCPNIIFITLDTVRADHLSSYGYSRPTTPRLDQIARHGVLFENAVAPASWTLASHASMFTELLPHQHGAGYDVPMPQGPRTLAEILGSRGYATAAFTSNFHYLEKG